MQLAALVRQIGENLGIEVKREYSAGEKVIHSPIEYGDVPEG